MLTDSIVKDAEPKEKPYKLSDQDGRGLCLLVNPDGRKYWRYRYRFDGKANMVSLGTYPDISLDEARKRLATARTMRATGIDPSKHKKATREEAKVNQANTFEAMAMEWYENEKQGWEPTYAKEVLRRLKVNLLSSLGSRPIKEITALEFLETLRKIEGRDAVTVAKRCRQMGSQIFSYAIVTGRAEYDVTATIKRALKAAPPVKNRQYLESHDLSQFMVKFNRHKEKPLTKLALRLLLLTFVRSKELREARWDEILWEKKQWLIPKHRMKMKRKHLVPLSRQAMDVLMRIREFSGHTPYLFPGSNNPKTLMGNNILLGTLYRMGYHSEATIHGFRATASTALGEMGFEDKHIEMQLAHAEPNQVKKAYNHAKYLPDRIRMMQHYADYLDAISKEGNQLTTWDFRVKGYKIQQCA